MTPPHRRPLIFRILSKVKAKTRLPLRRVSIRYLEPVCHRMVSLLTRAGLVKSRALVLALEDDRQAALRRERPFVLSRKPVIRWVKGPGKDDPVTRAAIAQATRLFGDRVDYCLCTNGIEAGRVRDILDLAAQPVEWWPVTPGDNPELAGKLSAAGCPPEHYGYWWKWFPERVRPEAPEWILDGDMVITGIPEWFDAWLAGTDPCRVTQDDRWPIEHLYGRYAGLVDAKLRLYSGLISLPPGRRYMDEVRKILDRVPLKGGHDGRYDMCEQGVIATAFQRGAVIPVPLYEFPFARAFEDHIDYGIQGDQQRRWGFHFGNSFKNDNPHFAALQASGEVYAAAPGPSLTGRCRWLGNFGQWGIPGWSMDERGMEVVLGYASRFAGRPVLEIGTSRGRLSAALALSGCQLTTVDRHDRGAAVNLAGSGVEVITAEAEAFLSGGGRDFDLVVVDLHGNSEACWRQLGPLLLSRVAPGGMLLINNATLWKIPEWSHETGVRWFMKHLPEGATLESLDEPIPGIAVINLKP